MRRTMTVSIVTVKHNHVRISTRGVALSLVMTGRAMVEALLGDPGYTSSQEELSKIMNV